MSADIQNGSGGLFDADSTLARIFPDENSRPRREWLLNLARTKGVGSVHVGRKVFFDPKQTERELRSLYSNQPNRRGVPGD